MTNRPRWTRSSFNIQAFNTLLGEGNWEFIRDNQYRILDVKPLNGKEKPTLDAIGNAIEYAVFTRRVRDTRFRALTAIRRTNYLVHESVYPHLSEESQQELTDYRNKAMSNIIAPDASIDNRELRNFINYDFFPRWKGYKSSEQIVELAQKNRRKEGLDYDFTYVQPILEKTNSQASGSTEDSSED